MWKTRATNSIKISFANNKNDFDVRLRVAVFVFSYGPPPTSQ